MDTDDLRIRRWGEIGDGYLGPAFHMRFKPGHVLYGSRRTYLRKVAIAAFEGITANTTYVLASADPNVLLPELLPFIMQTEAFSQHSVRESKGSVNPYINFSDLAWFEFALPPIEEQQRIARALQACEHVGETLRFLNARLSESRFAQLNQFFWLWHQSGAPLASVASVLSGGTPSKTNGRYWGGDRLWASAKDLKHRCLRETELHLTEEGWQLAKVAPEKATLIVVRGMILAHTFPVCWCETPTAINQDLRAIVARPPLLPEYLTLWAEWAAPWFLTRTSESSHGTKRIESEVLEDALVPVVDESAQRELIRCQESVLGQEVLLRERLSQAANLKRNLLNSVFEGE
jgi:type I restriction enzyme S subunit